jgi:molecular chaperone Hsp33
VRAYLKDVAARAPRLTATAGTRPALASALGASGVVSVIRDLGLRETFSGQTEMVSGEIDTDVEHYLNVSEQVDSALGCEVLFEGSDLGAELVCSAGLLVQALPGTGGAELVERARRQLRGGALARALSAGATDAAALAREVMGEDAADLRILDARPVRFACQCSRERAVDSLALLGSAELAAMIAEDGKAEVICNFCRERYDFSAVDLENIRREHQKDSPRAN